MLRIPAVRESRSEPQRGAASHPSRRPPSKRAHPPPPPSPRTWRRQPLCAAGGNAKCCSHPGDHEGGGFSADEPWNRHMVQIPLLRPRKTKSTKTRHAPQCLEQPHLQQPKQGSAQVSTDGSRRHSIYTRWSVSHEKEQDCRLQRGQTWRVVC